MYGQDQVKTTKVLKTETRMTYTYYGNRCTYYLIGYTYFRETKSSYYLQKCHLNMYTF